MRVVLDMQGAQSESRFRGIGRYTMDLALAMAREAGSHEVWLALNGSFPETVEPIRAAFRGLLPSEHVRVFHVPRPCAAWESGNAWRERAGEYIREEAMACLKPDWIHVFSLFEGLVDDAVTSIGTVDSKIPVSATLYDLIPFLQQDVFLPKEWSKKWYFRKLQSLKRADLLLAISKAVRDEAVSALGIPRERVINVGAGVREMFRPLDLALAKKEAILRRHGLARDYVMYTGAFGYNKNVGGLIKAFALLPTDLRRRYQLAIVGRLSEPEQDQLSLMVRAAGLRRDEVVICGYVSDDDLVVLYNSCALFVLPSLHEGFGLPALEAMACGAPVIGSNCSSIPEVIGREDALFDPTQPAAIAEKVALALSDGDFRRALIDHGLAQAGKFSWRSCARKVVTAIESYLGSRTNKWRPGWMLAPSVGVHQRLKLAFVSPLPPARTGIASYSSDLLPELGRFYDIDIINDQGQVGDPWVMANFPVRNTEWFEAHAGRYDRILYQFGNSPFHAHMFGLLERWPGVVTLHDFFLAGVRRWMEIDGGISGGFQEALYYSHGYRALVTRRCQGDEVAVMTYPCNLDVLDHATGIIVHSEHSCRLAEHWYGQDIAQDWRVIPQIRSLPCRLDRKGARERLGLADGDFLVCSFGFLDPTKLNERLLAAWISSALAKDPRCRLVLVGENHGGSYGRGLLESIRASGLGDRIRITGFVATDVYRDYLMAADAAVQLRASSRGETSRAILDGLAYGLPLIANAHGSNADYPSDVLLILPDEFDTDDLRRALERLYSDGDLRASLSSRGICYIAEHHHPARVADLYHDALEHFAGSCRQREQYILQKIANIECPAVPEEADFVVASAAVAANHPQDAFRRIFFDVSQVVVSDDKSGVPRVVRAILENLLKIVPPGFRIEPVRLRDGRYFYARRFTVDLLGLKWDEAEDAPVAVGSGDILLCADLIVHLVLNNERVFRDLKLHGAKIYFIIHDLLPVAHPEWFPQGLEISFSKWLDSVVGLADGLVCVSRTTADELIAWIDNNSPMRHTPIGIGYYHLGADLEASFPTSGMPPDGEDVLKALRKRRTFLMVGTIEPRKGHAQALDAFEILWRKGVEINLVIVGRRGWLMETFIERLKSHSELDRRLFWMEGVSDEFLGKIYAASSALLAASQGEGFGLPLIEAARHGVPIVARDIPVFREVAGAYAFYFRGTAPEDLASAIESWLALYAEGKVPGPEGIKWLTWEKSTKHLLDIVMNGKWHAVLAGKN